MSQEVQAEVLLGLVDQKICDRAAVDFSVSKIGGNPDGLGKQTPLPSCRLCQNRLLLVVQIYCPLDVSDSHRTLHVFTCINKACWNKAESWLVLRSEQQFSMAKETDNLKERPDIIKAKTTEWCDDADDWGDSDDDQCNTQEYKLNKLETQNQDSCDQQNAFVNIDHKELSDLTEGDIKEKLDDLTLNESCEHSELSQENIETICIAEECLEDRVKQILKEHPVSSQMQEPELKTLPNEIVFDSFYLSVVEESYYFSVEYKHEKKLMSEYAERERVDFEAMLENPSARRCASGAAEKYEKSDARHGDKKFDKFLRKLSVCPSQVIRYCWCGDPLLMTSCDLDPPCCEHCGADRVFEFQIMPALVYQLNLPNVQGPAVEFGTVMVYSCRNSCWDYTDSYRQEAVLVQADPDHHLFR